MQSRRHFGFFLILTSPVDPIQMMHDLSESAAPRPKSSLERKDARSEARSLVFSSPPVLCTLAKANRESLRENPGALGNANLGFIILGTIIGWNNLRKKGKCRWWNVMVTRLWARINARDNELATYNFSLYFSALSEFCSLSFRSFSIFV